MEYPDHIVHSSTQPEREHFQGWDTLGNMVPCLTTLRVENFFLLFYPNLLSFILKPCPVITCPLKYPSPGVLLLPSIYWKGAIRSLRSLHFYRLTNSNPLNISSSIQPSWWPFSGLAPTGWDPSCAEDLRARCSTLGGVFFFPNASFFFFI